MSLVTLVKDEAMGLSLGAWTLNDFLRTQSKKVISGTSRRVWGAAAVSGREREEERGPGSLVLGLSGRVTESLGGWMPCSADKEGALGRFCSDWI